MHLKLAITHTKSDKPFGGTQYRLVTETGEVVENIQVTALSFYRSDTGEEKILVEVSFPAEDGFIGYKSRPGVAALVISSGAKILNTTDPV